MAISILMLPKMAATMFERKPVPAMAGYGQAASGGERAMSATLALGIAGGIGVALAAALTFPEIVREKPAPDTPIYNIPIEKQPKPDKPIQVDERKERTDFTRPDKTIPSGADDAPTGTLGEDTGTTGPETGTGTGNGEIFIEKPFVPPPPVFIAARRDPRFASAFQPPYPAGMLRDEREGRCPVSVNISAAGRVTAVEDRGCSDPAFLRATQRHALARWRFQPATRDGTPVESTQTLTVVFEIGQ